ncbi:hypothetical protein HDU87_008770 [Geranomyces variabilis]|uniref:Uncharacterized protein n=1 Tax=Geranomyces variabilis TaxID=109894 RepID=A0AAD5XP23_9FUNG|nr:hypothetical protein HDU87_008770 [Geranomyces variabilis]
MSSRIAAIAGHLAANPSANVAPAPVRPRHREARDVQLAVQIAGMGRFVPPRIETNEELEALYGFPVGAIKRMLGLDTRYRADKDMTAPWMGAQAAKAALNDAGMTTNDIDLVINASAIPERLIPDDAPLIAYHLGMSSSHVPCFSVHATCMSFVLALQTAAAYIESRVYRNILIVSSEKLDGHLNFKDLHSSALFGDLAVACVVRPTPTTAGATSAINRVLMETNGEHYDLATHPLRPQEKAAFKMQGPALLKWSHDNLPGALEAFQPGLTRGLLGDIKCVIPHQASKKGLEVVKVKFGWGDKVIDQIFPEFGNTVSTGIPHALYYAIQTGKLQRGDKALIVGTGAGLSLVVMSLTY